MPPFKVGVDPRNDWVKWQKAFDRFLRANKIVDDEEKFDMLLVLGGIELQEYFDKVGKYEVQNVTETGEIVVLQYDSAVISLEKYFAPQLNKRFERHLFRAMKQEENEPFSEFIFRLQNQAKRSNFVDADDMVIDQVIEGCKSTELRKKLLTDDMKLVDVMTLGKTVEEVQKQSKQYERPTPSTFERSVVQRVVEKRPEKYQSTESGRRCYNCNRPGHLAKESEKCAAKNAICHSCGSKGHFKACCRRRKRADTQQWGGPPPKRTTMHAILDDNAVTSKGMFAINDDKQLNEVLMLEVGGVNMKMLVDSGSPANIMNSESYKWLKHQGANILNERCPQEGETNLTPFASDRKIFFSSVFETEIRIPGEESGIWTHVLVAPDGQTNILSKSAAFALGVLKIGYNIHQIESKPDSNKISEAFPKVPNVTLKIQIDGKISPVVQVARRLPVSMEADVEEAIRDLLEKNIIERAEGPLSWVSPLVPVRKADGKIRLCVDMRAANRAVIRENYPMPNIDAAMTSITKVAKLSKIDLEAAYYHFELDEGSRYITTFVARSGVYRFRRLMFGIKSAPELFQREMENLFRGIRGVIVYMDDLLVHGATEEEHDSTLKLVLQILKDMNMRINEQKSVYSATEVVFLGHYVSNEGIRPTDERVKAILELQAPSSVTELRSLLGLINFVGRFVRNLSSLTFHMRELLHKDSCFKWTSVHDKELKNVKSILGKVETLAYFDPSDETQLITDASPYGLGAVLIQIKSGVSRPVSCISKSLAVHEKKYCQTEKECLAIIWAMEKLFVYLYGTHFTLITDCKPLEYLFNRVQSKPSARIERWILRLQSFDFVVRYEPGTNNIADPLSRMSQSPEEAYGEADCVAWLAEEIRPAALSIEEIETATTRDDELQAVKDAIFSGNWDSVSAEFKTATIKDDLTVYGELILRGDRIVIPKQLREKVVHLAHSGHQGCTSMKSQLRAKVWFPLMDKLVETTVHSCKPCKMTAIPDSPNPILRRIPTGPWQDIAIDFKEGLSGGLSLLVVVCYTTRFIQVEPMRPATAQRVIAALLRMFSVLGIPRSITADNGPQFRADEFSRFCICYGIHLNLSTPYWPEQNGAVERQMRNIGKRLKISEIQGTDWQVDLYEYLTMYHATPQETTGVSPGQMMLGREIRTRIPSIRTPSSLQWEGARDRDMAKKEYHKQKADALRHAKEHKLGRGDTVLMRNLNPGALDSAFRGEEFEVVDVNRSAVKVKSTETGKVYLRNSAHLKRLDTTAQATKSDELGSTRDESEEAETTAGLQEATNDRVANTSNSNQLSHRRMRKLPNKYADYILDD